MNFYDTWLPKRTTSHKNTNTRLIPLLHKLASGVNMTLTTMIKVKCPSFMPTSQTDIISLCEPSQFKKTLGELGKCLLTLDEFFMEATIVICKLGSRFALPLLQVLSDWGLCIEADVCELYFNGLDFHSRHACTWPPVSINTTEITTWSTNSAMARGPYH